MSVARRRFVRSLAPWGRSTEWVSARGHGAATAEEQSAASQAGAPAASISLRLDSNENPLGPGPRALDALERAFGNAGRYPMNAKPATADFQAIVARRHGLQAANVAIGAGSGEILDCAVRAFVAPGCQLVSAAPTFEAPARVAKRLELPLTEIPVDAAGRLDLDGMIAASTGAGLVFLCNPNNPTGAVQAAVAISEAVDRIHKQSPGTVVLIDEAYHDYVTDRSYATAVPFIRRYPNLIVSRTLSKAHGMAGLRLGFALGQAALIDRLARWLMPFNANVLVLAAASASLEDDEHIERERRRNTDVLKFTTGFFRNAGFETSDSQANFVWVNLKRPAQEFAAACGKQGVLVGRGFPPFEKTHARISIGTMDEMERATRVFRSVLAGGPL